MGAGRSLGRGPRPWCAGGCGFLAHRSADSGNRRVAGGAIGGGQRTFHRCRARARSRRSTVPTTIAHRIPIGEKTSAPWAERSVGLNRGSHRDDRPELAAVVRHLLAEHARATSAVRQPGTRQARFCLGYIHDRDAGSQPALWLALATGCVPRRGATINGGFDASTRRCWSASQEPGPSFGSCASGALSRGLASPSPAQQLPNSGWRRRPLPVPRTM